MDRWLAGTHGGTYGGNPVSCAAAAATIEVLRNGLVDNAERMGPVLMTGLCDLQARYPVIGDVRGLGLMVATEFTLPGGEPATEVVKQVIAHCRHEGLLLLNCGTYNQVVRWIPPLLVTKEQIEEALGIFEHALAKVT
jgi:4-aminobutyrate aminotransferase-like enzyme